MELNSTVSCSGVVLVFAICGVMDSSLRACMLILLDVYLIFITGLRDIIIINKSHVNFTFLFLDPKPSVSQLFSCQSSLSFLQPVLCLSRLDHDYIAVYYPIMI